MSGGSHDTVTGVLSERALCEGRKEDTLNDKSNCILSGARIAKTIYIMSEGSNDTVTGVLSGRALCEGRKEDTLNEHHHQ